MKHYVSKKLLHEIVQQYFGYVADLCNLQLSVI